MAPLVPVVSDAGGKFLQTSGMRIEFNPQIPIGFPRILSLKIWDNALQEWKPIERLQLYRFASDSYTCNSLEPYPAFLGKSGNLTIPGEKPGALQDDLIQEAVVDFMGSLDQPYDASFQGRYVNNTQSYEVLDLVQNKDECLINTYWSVRSVTCFPCPDSTHVVFSDEKLDFFGQSTGHGGSIIPLEGAKMHISAVNTTNSLFRNALQGRILLVNREVSNFTVVPKVIPNFLKFVDKETGEYSDRFVEGGPYTPLPSGSSLVLDFILVGSFQTGTAIGTVSFGILGARYGAQTDDFGIFDCDDYTKDATFDVELHVTPPPELNQLGGWRYVGIGLMSLILLSAIASGYFLIKHRESPSFKSMQPLFLAMICFGIVILSLTILPLSIDDELHSENVCDTACMSAPWLLSMGLTVTFSALFSKLWRVNKLFGRSTMRRTKVTERDVALPFVVLLSTNVMLLTAWTLADPSRWERMIVEGEEWKTYGACRSGDTGTALMSVTYAIDFIALVLACHQGMFFALFGKQNGYCACFDDVVDAALIIVLSMYSVPRTECKRRIQ